MRIKVVNLTAAQTTALTTGDWPEGFVIDHRQTYAILDGTPERCLRVVQERMDAIREASGSASGQYRALGSVRIKLELASKAPKGVTSHVQIVPNGMDVTPEAPAVLNGKVKGEPKPDAGKRREVAQPAPLPVEVAHPTPLPSMPHADAETVRVAIENYRAMASNVKTDAAKDYWLRKIEDMRTRGSVLA